MPVTEGEDKWREVRLTSPSFVAEFVAVAGPRRRASPAFSCREPSQEGGTAFAIKR